MKIVAVAAAYYVAARVGLLLQLPGTNASPVWPPSGIGLAAVLMLGWRVWPGIAIGALLANLLTLPFSTAGFLASAGIGVGNTLEHVVALLLIRALVDRESPFEHAADVFKLVLTAGVACAVASTTGATSLWLAGIISGKLFQTVWFTWWLGDTAGMLVIAPAIYCWWRQPRPGLSAARLVELFALALVTVAVAELLFGGWLASEIIDSLPYLVVPGLLWAAFRFGPRETATMSVLISIVAVGHTWRLMKAGEDDAAARAVFAPFVSPDLTANDSLLMLQIFACTVAVTAMTLAAALFQQRTAEEINERSAEALRERDVRISSLLNSTAEGIYGLDLDGKCTFANQACVDLLGYDSADELLGVNMHDLIHHTRPDGTSYAMHECRIYQAFREGQGVHVDDEVLWRKDGTSFAAEYWSYPIRRDGQVLGSVLTFMDITDRKEAEAAIQRINEELQQKNDEIQQFVYTVSHDLKSPLVTCKGFIGVMKEDAEDERWDEMLDSVSRLDRATDRLSELIEDLLQLSRVGVVRNEPEQIDVAELVRSIADDLSARLQQAGASLLIDDDLPDIVADRVRLGEVFENLLTNAIKYGCQGEEPRIVVGSETVQGELRYFVQDNGPGIPKEFHRKIFRLFQRLDVDQEGTGVGLTAVARIMEVHGGRAGVESEPGHGAKFWVSFP